MTGLAESIHVYRDGDFEGGLSCPVCHRVHEDGDLYVERLDGVAVDCEFTTVGFCPDCLPPLLRQKGRGAD